MAQQVVVITLHWMIQSFKDFCRKFSCKSTVSGKSLVQKVVVLRYLINSTPMYYSVHDKSYINYTCVYNM